LKRRIGAEERIDGLALEEMKAAPWPGNVLRNWKLAPPAGPAASSIRKT